MTKMVRLRMPAGSWAEIGHDGTAYTVSNSGNELGMNECLVPEHVAQVLLATASGAVRVDDSEPAPPDMSLTPMLVPPGAPSDGPAIGWHGNIYEAHDGIVMIPAAAVQDAIVHGFVRPVIED